MWVFFGVSSARRTFERGGIFVPWTLVGNLLGINLGSCRLRLFWLDLFTCWIGVWLLFLSALHYQLWCRLYLSVLEWYFLVQLACLKWWTYLGLLVSHLHLLRITGRWCLFCLGFLIYHNHIIILISVFDLLHWLIKFIILFQSWRFLLLWLDWRILIYSTKQLRACPWWLFLNRYAHFLFLLLLQPPPISFIILFNDKLSFVHKLG